MSEIKSVTIEMINLGNAIMRKYSVEYFTGAVRTFGVPPSTVEKFINENRRELSMVKYMFKDHSGSNERI